MKSGALGTAFAVAISFAFAVGPARAIPFNPADFAVVEGPGVYTVINNSADWYVISILVSNPAAGAGGTASTTQPNWLAVINPLPGFQYFDQFTSFTGGALITNPSFGLTNDIGPGSSNSNFAFTGSPASQYFLLVVSPDDETTSHSVIGETTAATPLPAALLLFATGLGGLGLLGWRRKKKAAQFAA